MASASGPSSSDTCFDPMLAECAAGAARALEEPRAWKQLEGRARQCYERLLLLVACMHSVNGANAETVWGTVSGLVDRFQKYERLQATLDTVAEDSEPFALSSAQVQVVGSTQCDPQVPQAVPGPFSGSGGKGSNPYSKAAATRGGGGLQEPLSKRLKGYSGPSDPRPTLEATSDPGRQTGYSMPFGAISAPHQVMLDMGAAPPMQPANQGEAISSTPKSTSAGALYVALACCQTAEPCTRLDVSMFEF